MAAAPLEHRRRGAAADVTKTLALLGEDVRLGNWSAVSVHLSGPYPPTFPRTGYVNASSS
jgi:hypothetical protein